MAGNRQFNFVGFLKATVAPTLQERGEVVERPILGIDECLNNEEHIGALGRRLVARGVVSWSMPLWYSMRVTASGKKLSVPGGSITPSVLFPDPGRQIRGWSWPDEGVIASLISYFILNDRLCLLTRDTAKNASGLRHILESEVSPTLESLTPRRLGLLVIAQKYPSSGNLASYAEAVESRLTSA